MKRNNPLNIFKIFSEPTRAPVSYFLLYFFVVTPLLGLFINGLSSLIFETVCTWLEAHWGQSKVFWQFCFALLFLVLLVPLLIVSHVQQFLRELRDRVFGNQNAPQINTKELTETFPGLIVLASPTPITANRPTPAEVVIRHHLQDGKLQHCWIICTEESRSEAKNIIDKLVAEGKCGSHIFHYPDSIEKKTPNHQESLNLLIPPDKADDPNYICELVDGIYQEANAYNMEDLQIITDYTGATKSMTAGVILACTNPERRLQYISQSQRNKNGSNLLIEVEISYKLKPLKTRH
jgi:CRISPR-associated protein (Cas_Cas02710)